MQLRIGEWLRKYVDRTPAPNETTTMSYPPPIAPKRFTEAKQYVFTAATLRAQMESSLLLYPAL